ncbi:MAG: uridine kinase [Anaerolineae bacterium]|nr:uridine kinase [Anaerolineae bacterium]
MQRSVVLDSVAQQIGALSAAQPVCVGIDGIDTAGKTTFADELAVILQETRRQVIRASVDGFHNPRAVRYQRGKLSPEGYYSDTFNVNAIRELLLDPLSEGGSRRYCTANYDLAHESPIEPEYKQATEDAILIVDGVFLHRPELRSYWDFSVYLNISPATALQRAFKRDTVVFGSIEAVQDRYQRRYIPGQQLYLDRCQPAQIATVVIDHNDVDAPHVMSERVQPLAK